MSRRDHSHLIGIDFQRIVQRGAAEMMRQGEDYARKQLQAKYTYTEAPELTVMVFEERSNPPLWRMETLREGPNGMGIVKVRDPDPEMLEAELRTVLSGKLYTYDVCKTPADARWSAANIKIRNMGTIRLRDSERHEGERSRA